MDINNIMIEKEVRDIDVRFSKRPKIRKGRNEIVEGGIVIEERKEEKFIEITDEGMEFDDCNERIEAKDEENAIDISDKESNEKPKDTEDEYIEPERRAKRRKESGK
jgi:hypothetical protein